MVRIRSGNQTRLAGKSPNQMEDLMGKSSNKIAFSIAMFGSGMVFRLNYNYLLRTYFSWLEVSTPLKNMKIGWQLGWLFPIYVK